jgi:3D (Asp-Asp-Asp) domain-containing protein
VHLKTLLVSLSLLTPYTAATVDKHKQPSGRFAKGRKFVARAYASGYITKGGNKPVAGTTIAADPKIIPLGSRVLVSDAGEYSGVYLVDDIGGAIKGNKIDIYMNSHAEAIEFGRQDVLLTVLSVPRRGSHVPDKTAMIAVDESPGSTGNPAGRALAAGRAGDSSREGDSWQSRGS